MVVCPFVLFLLAIVLSVLLRYTNSDCPFGIFKLFLKICWIVPKNIYSFWIKLFYFILEVRSTKHTYKTKDRVTRTPVKTAGELRCSGRVGSSCSTSGTRRVNLVTNPVISREWWKDREVFTSGTYPSQTFHFMRPLYEVYISQMIRYSRACGSYQDFLDRGLLLTRVPFGKVEVITSKILKLKIE
jgi:hypothetical protein